MEDLINDIKSAIKNSQNHILNNNELSRYYNDFITKLGVLSDSTLLNTNKKMNNFKFKLQLKNDFDQFTYFQGISEILIWLFCLKNNLDFALEKRVSSENRKDIDVQIVNRGFTFNVEVKCPKFELKYSDTLNIVNGFRTVPKEQVDKAICELKNLISENIQDKDESYKYIKNAKMSDNKLVDYLKSGQEKFSDSSDNTLNIVMVTVRSIDLQHYWEYLYNGFSGLFTSNSFCDNDEYSKIDAVLLTNMVEGHINISEEYNAWEIENYCNLLCINPFKVKNGKLSDKYTAFLELFPNSTLQFEEYYSRFIKTIKHEPALNLEYLLFPHYMDKYHSLQWNS